MHQSHEALTRSREINQLLDDEVDDGAQGKQLADQESDDGGYDDDEDTDSEGKQITLEDLEEFQCLGLGNGQQDEDMGEDDEITGEC